jgi:hypothetical protein
MEHTTGPWTAHEHTVTAKWETGEEVQICLAGTTKWCGLTEESTRLNKRLSAEMTGNLALIAAAPELLTQLKALVVQIEFARLIVPPNVRAVIEKAEGR